MSDVAAAAAPAAEGTTVIDTNPPAAGAESAPAVETQTPSLDDTLSAAWDKSQTGVDRGDDGRFVARTPDGKEHSSVQDAVNHIAKDSAVQPPAEKVEPAPPAIDYPQSWTAEGRDLWAKLPPEYRALQEIAAKRDSETHKAITSYGDRLKSYEPLDKVITQYKADFEKRGLDAARATATLFEAQRALDASPIDGLISIGLTYGIDLRPLLAGQQGQVPASDPRYGQLEQRLNQTEQKLQQQLTQQHEQQAAADAAMVKEFASEINADKSLKRPYFEDVRAVMASLLKDGHAENLQAAYDMAVMTSPKIRERIQADQRKADEEKRKADEARQKEELKKKAEDAAKAARLNVKSGTAHPNPKTMTDTIEETARRLYG